MTGNWSCSTPLAPRSPGDHAKTALRALRRGKVANSPPEAAGRAERAGAHESGAIPARCPVLGKPVCYRCDCRHYQGGGCAHPEATAAKPQRRRRAKK